MRAFTLLELTIASVMIIAIAAVCLAILLTVHFTQKEAQIRNATTRDAQLVIDVIGEDLKYFGVGVPFAANVQGAFGCMGGPACAPLNTNIQLRPALRIAEEHYMAFLGDLPYPNADLNGIATLSDMQGNPALAGADAANSDTFAISSELSGCVPGAACNTSATSMIWGGAAPENCTDANAHYTPGAVPATGRSCPWGLNKWLENSSGFVDLVVTAPTGIWAAERWDMTDSASVGVVDRGQLMVNMDDDFPAAGASPLRRRPFADARAGASMVAQLDRVFFSAEEPGGTPCHSGTAAGTCRLYRRQCWGPLGDPGSPNFPRAATSSTAANLLSPSAPGNCGAPNDGTPWEPIVGGISAFRLAYYDAFDVLIPTPISARTDLQRVASVDVLVTIERKAPQNGRPGDPKTMHQTMSRRFYLQNYGPFVDQYSPCTTPSCFSGNP